MLVETVRRRSIEWSQFLPHLGRWFTISFIRHQTLGKEHVVTLIMFALDERVKEHTIHVLNELEYVCVSVSLSVFFLLKGHRTPACKIVVIHKQTMETTRTIT